MHYHHLLECLLNLTKFINHGCLLRLQNRFFTCPSFLVLLLLEHKCIVFLLFIALRIVQAMLTFIFRDAGIFRLTLTFNLVNCLDSILLALSLRFLIYHGRLKDLLRCKRLHRPHRARDHEIVRCAGGIYCRSHADLRRVQHVSTLLEILLLLIDLTHKLRTASRTFLH